MYGYRYYYFSLNISEDMLLEVYRGSVKRLRVRTEEGLVVDLDAAHLKKFTDEHGVHGRFRLTVTCENSFVSLERTN
ncbi:MAG TPA: DUF2835 domain-containing protein [Succinivibrionaceae bacterium]|nr:DUF2835 domain-containing protein [Succinivibrionaceae bacterium]